MSTQRFVLAAVLLAGGLLSPVTLGQGSTFPPFFIEIKVTVSDDNGIFLYDRTLNFEDGVPDDTVFGDVAGELLLEEYIVEIEIKVGDRDIEEDEPNFYQRRQTRPATFYSPTPPAFTDGQDSDEFNLTPNAENPVRGMSPGGDPRWELTWSYFPFRIPQFLGVSQRRLAGLQVFDVGWFMMIEIADAESPGDDVIVQSKLLTFYARENPGLRPGDAPPFADAGGNSTVSRDPATGESVARLNAGLTFDSTNVGFDTADPRIFAKDVIEYDWELIAYPPEWTPNYAFEPRDPREPTAVVRLQGTQVGQVFQFRVLARDGVNPMPSASVVEIVIADPVAPNQAPTASAGNDLTVGVGGTITLSGALSMDPDGDTLTYLWRQTNAVGGLLAPDQVETAFQPVAGINSVASTWRSVAVGTYYFRLIVTDPSGDSDYDDVVVVVSENGPTSARTLGASVEEAAADTVTPLFGLGLCGAGLAPVALVPLVLFPMRKRIR
jgi:hypothetical protein